MAAAPATQLSRRRSMRWGNHKEAKALCSKFLGIWFVVLRRLRVKGPVMIPTKTLLITTSKSPCGEAEQNGNKKEKKLNGVAGSVLKLNTHKLADSR
ncbi:40S ribosomal protein S20 (Fragment) [Linum perenne]